ncbi:polysaccharide biosynthesis tyrosine autokinase [Leucothrix sargassi]|nr:polysaccharide biosynthesis tyrosine autokinase [Leucothrix sargassi]
MSIDSNQRLPSRVSSSNASPTAPHPSTIYPEELLAPSNGLNLKEFIGILSRRKWLVVTTVLCTLLAVILITLMIKPVYRANSTIQIERNAAGLSSSNLQSVESRSDKDFHETQRQLIQSKTLARRVINQLGLDAKDTSFGVIASIKNALGMTPVDRSSAERTEALFLDNLTVQPISNSQLVQINYDSTDPKLAADISNAIAKTFVRMNLEKRFNVATYSTEFLTEQIEEVREALERSEKALNDYAREHGIVQDSEGENTDTQSLKSLSQELVIAQRDRIQAEALLAQAQDTNSQDPSTIAILSNDPALQDKGTQLVQAIAQRNDLIQKSSSGTSRAIRRLDTTVRNLRAEINAKASTVIATLKIQAESALKRQELIEQQLNSLKTTTISAQGDSIRYNTLQREVESNQVIYTELLQQYKSAKVAGENGTNNITIIDKAGVPYEKHKPRLRNNVAFGLLLGLMLGMGAAFLREFMDDTLKSSDELERITALPVLGLLPNLKNHSYEQVALLAHMEPRSPLAEAIRSLRTSLKFSTQYGAPRVTFITSSNPSEGKSSIALNLATAYAQVGGKVLLIDADLRNPSIHQLLKLDNLEGLTNYLAGAGDAENISRPCLIKQLRVITSGPIPPDPVELLSGKRMQALLDAASEEFDHIIIDGPPVIGLADALVLSNLADATILSVQAGKTRKASLIATLKRLERTSGNIIGTLLSRVDQSSNPEYSEDSYYTYTNDSKYKNSNT